MSETHAKNEASARRCWLGLRRIMLRLSSWAQKREESIAGYGFLLPTAIVVAVFVVFPVGFSIYLSLHEWDFLTKVHPFVGLQHYRTLLTSRDFWRVVRNTAYFSVGSIPATLIVALVLAILLNRKIRGLTFYRAAYFAPVVTSAVVAGQIWAWLFDPRLGLLNSIMKLLGLPSQQWILDPKLVMPCIIVMSVWQGAGYIMVIYLAALQGIPTEYYDAARVDGATKWQLFTRVTMPLLKPTTFFATIMLMIRSFQVFGQIFVIAWQTPLMSRTESIVIYLYKHGFYYQEMGFASAVAWLLFAIIFIFTLLQFRFRRRFEIEY